MAVKGKRAKKNANQYSDLSTLKGTKLVNSLKEIREVLRNAEEESSVSGYTTLSSQLTSDALLKNETREISQYVGFCLVEVYRLNEGLGFSDDVNKTVMEHVIHNLRLLETPSRTDLYRFTFDMFERLSQTPLLKCFLSLGSEGQELCLHLFQTLFAILDSYTSTPSPRRSKSKSKRPRPVDPASQLTEEELASEQERVSHTAMEVAVSSLDLFKHIPDSLLDLLLMTLLPPSDTPDAEKLPSGRFVESLLSVKRSKLVAPVQRFCTRLLCMERDSQLLDARDHVRVRMVFHADFPHSFGAGERNARLYDGFASIPRAGVTCGGGLPTITSCALSRFPLRRNARAVSLVSFLPIEHKVPSRNSAGVSATAAAPCVRP